MRMTLKSISSLSFFVSLVLFFEPLFEAVQIFSLPIEVYQGSVVGLSLWICHPNTSSYATDHVIREKGAGPVLRREHEGNEHQTESALILQAPHSTTFS